MPNANRTKEAFREKGNIIGVAAIGALALATLSPLPLLVGLVAEAAYLLFVPDSAWYVRLCKVREAISAQQQRASTTRETLPALCPGTRERYLRLQQLCRQIGEKTGDQQLFNEAPRKFDYLLDKFLAFAVKEAQFSQYLSSVHEEVCGTRPTLQAGRESSRGSSSRPSFSMVTPQAGAFPPKPAPLDTSDPWVAKAIAEIRAKYTSDLSECNTQLDKEDDPNTKAVLAKRVEILKRREEFLGKIEKALSNVTHQLQLLEDTFGLINDEISARSPEQVLEDINDVITQTDTMTQVLDEMAPYEQIATRLQQSA